MTWARRFSLATRDAQHQRGHAVLHVARAIAGKTAGFQRHVFARRGVSELLTGEKTVRCNERKSTRLSICFTGSRALQHNCAQFARGTGRRGVAHAGLPALGRYADWDRCLDALGAIPSHPPTWPRRLVMPLRRKNSGCCANHRSFADFRMRTFGTWSKSAASPASMPMKPSFAESDPGGFFLVLLFRYGAHFKGRTHDRHHWRRHQPGRISYNVGRARQSQHDVASRKGRHRFAHRDSDAAEQLQICKSRFEKTFPARHGQLAGGADQRLIQPVKGTHCTARAVSSTSAAVRASSRALSRFRVCQIVLALNLRPTSSRCVLC